MGFFDPFGGNTSGNGSGGSDVSIDTTLTQSGKAADAKVTGDKIKKIETDGVATINEVKVVGELDSIDDLKIAGKVFEFESLEIPGEIFNDYENNIANGPYSHAEGYSTTASGLYSHAEGANTKASGHCSHAEGEGNIAIGTDSHAEGRGTTARSSYQHVQGKYNVTDSANKYAFIIGNGTNERDPSNAFAIDWNGNIYVNNSSTGVNLNTVVSDIADRYTKSQTYTKTETDNAIASKIAEVIANAPEDFNTLKEISTWIEEHADDAATMNLDIQNLKADKASKSDVYTKTEVDNIITTKIAEANIVSDSVTGEKYKFKISNGVLELEKVE